MKTIRLAVCCVLPLLAACGSTSKAPRPAGAGTLVVTVDGFEDLVGEAWIALFLGPVGFPDEGQRAFRYAHVPVTSNVIRLTFEDVPAGPFAISAFHDVNGNDVLDTDFFGIPSEDWGVSRDAGGFLGPPSYESARLELQAGQTLDVRFPIG